MEKVYKVNTNEKGEIANEELSKLSDQIINVGSNWGKEEFNLALDKLSNLLKSYHQKYSKASVLIPIGKEGDFNSILRTFMSFYNEIGSISNQLKEDSFNNPKKIQINNLINETIEIVKRLDDLLAHLDIELERYRGFSSMNDFLLFKDLMQTEMTSKLDEELKKVTNLKDELGVQLSFTDSISNRLKRSRKRKNLSLFFLIVCILLIPTSYIFFNSIADLSLKNVGNGYDLFLPIGTRLLMTITLLSISLICFNQFKINYLLFYKYEHLYSFIGGGATVIAEKLDLDNETRVKMNNKLVNMFLDSDDIVNVIIKSKHPTNLTTKQIEHITKLISAVNKTN